MKAGQTLQGTGDEKADLEGKQWAVISFLHVEATGLTYDAAAEVMSELVRKKVPGLCIITERAAARAGSGEPRSS
ncbi:MAG: hypothetical protein ABI539_11895 [Acidobacteriota bacterium]